MPEQEQRYYSQALGELPAQNGMTVLISPMGEYIGLDKNASLVWTLLTQQGMSVAQAITLLQREYAAGDCTTEIDAFVSQMESHQLLSHSPQIQSIKHISIPWRTFQILSVQPNLQAAIALRWITLQIHRGQVLPLIKAIAEIKAAKPKALYRKQAHDLAHLLSVLAMPGQLCLHQGLAAFMILRLKGYDVNFNLGVHTHPFEAHAWVSYGDGPIVWWAGLGGEESAVRLKSFEVIYQSGCIGQEVECV